MFGRCLRVALAGAGLLVALAVPPAHLHGQEADLPALVYVCPMHADQVSHEKGECPICGMGLEPMRLDTVYTCPIHAVVSERHPASARSARARSAKSRCRWSGSVAAPTRN